MDQHHPLPCHHLNETVIFQLIQPQAKKVNESDDDVDPTIYVFNVTFNVDETLYACSGSNDLIKIYNSKTNALVSQLKGHTNTISSLFWSPTDPNVIYSSSYDESVRAWDVKTTKPFKIFRGPGGIQFNTLAVNEEGMVAAGADGLVIVWSMKTGKRALTLDSHNTDVTHVMFHPTMNHILYSGSVDGLICVSDTNNPDEEDALGSVFNLNDSISKFGFFGPQNDFLYIITHTERLYIWSVTEEMRVFDFGENFRDFLSEKVQEEVHYLINCKYTSEQDLLLFGGNYSGDLFVFQLGENQVNFLGKLSGGHTAVVRDLAISQQKTIMLTCGEDSKISVWQTTPPKESKSSNKLKISEKLTFRHEPYKKK